MARVSRVFGGFADPARRPKWIIITVVVLVVLGGALTSTFMVTTNTRFCENACHKVQDDTVKAYTHSVHSKVDCVTCHLPVGGNPLTFVSHEIGSLREVAETLTNTYTLPQNKNDEVALTMPAKQCTQCHDMSKSTATLTPRAVVLHQVHTINQIACTICHNRVAHNEDFPLTLVDPTGAKNQKHPDFMTMPACFRCHTQEPVKGAPAGRCTMCHAPGSTSTPTSHESADFAKSGHAMLASKEESRAPWLTAKEASATARGAAQSATGAAAQSATQTGAGESSPYANGLALKKVAQVNTCSTCHAKSFCTDCHGLEMPHPASFKKKTHGQLGIAKPQVCQKCHGSGRFCSDCHHGTELNAKLSSSRTWLQQHSRVADLSKQAGCIQPGGCHSSVYCADCHANGGKLPAGAPPL
jgi:Cytochrome c7 and related cytochrome c